jgi:hypothetical protein
MVHWEQYSESINAITNVAGYNKTRHEYTALHIQRFKNKHFLILLALG